MTEQPASFTPTQINFSDLELGERARKVYGDVREFANRIKKFGLMHNIVAFKKPDNGKYKIIAGGRRYRAIELLLNEEPDRWSKLWVKIGRASCRERV